MSTSSPPPSSNPLPATTTTAAAPNARKWGTDTYSKWSNFSDADTPLENAEKVLMDFNIGDNSSSNYVHGSFSGTGSVSGSVGGGTGGIIDLKYIPNIHDHGALILTLPSGNTHEEIKRPTVPTLSLTSSLNLPRIMNLPIHTREVWGIDVCALRVWSESAFSGKPVRPLTVICLCLYPEGGVLSHAIPSFEHEFGYGGCELLPTAQSVVNMIVNNMLNPPTNASTKQANTPQHRPSRIVTSNLIIVQELKEVLLSIGIEISYLHPAVGIKGLCCKMSDNLIRDDLANRDAGSEGLSLMSSNSDTELTLFEVDRFYASMRELYERKVWESFSGRQVFRIEGEGDYVDGGDGRVVVGKGEFVYVCLINESNGDDGDANENENGEGEDQESSTTPIVGLSLFHTRTSLESRLIPASHRSQIYRSTAITQCTGNPAIKGSVSRGKGRGKGGTLKRLNPRMYDVRDGKEVAFSSVAAQKVVWKELKPFLRLLSTRDDSSVDLWSAKTKTGDVKGREIGREVGECSVLFRNYTMVPFDELDYIGFFDFGGFGGRRNSTDSNSNINNNTNDNSNDDDDNRYPSIQGLTHKGSLVQTAVGRKNVIWLSRCAQVLCDIAGEGEGGNSYGGGVMDVMDIVDVCKVDCDSDNDNADDEEEYEVIFNDGVTVKTLIDTRTLTSGGEEEELKVTYEPVWLKSEVKSAYGLMVARKSDASGLKDGADGVSNEEEVKGEDEGEENDKQDEGEDSNSGADAGDELREKKGCVIT